MCKNLACVAHVCVLALRVRLLLHQVVLICAVPCCNSLHNTVWVFKKSLRQQACARFFFFTQQPAGLSVSLVQGLFPASVLFLSLVCAIMDRTLPHVAYYVELFINTVAVVLMSGT